MIIYGILNLINCKMYIGKSNKDDIKSSLYRTSNEGTFING